jgi:hypothetical protein
MSRYARALGELGTQDLLSFSEDIFVYLESKEPPALRENAKTPSC